MSNFYSRKIKMMCRSEKIAYSGQRAADSVVIGTPYGERTTDSHRDSLRRKKKLYATCGRAKRYTENADSGFSLVEVLTALAILALISSSVLVVIDRCVVSAADSSLRMQAFEVARENMEKLLASPLVQETVEYGESDTYLGITWQTVVETFYEPITARMWVRGICSAEYIDMEGQKQTVELTHWLTGLTKGQLLDIMTREDEEGQLAAQLIATIEESAEYAGVDVQTIERWLENGMLKTGDGSFVRMNLDIYKRSGGNPSPEDKSLQVRSEAELIKLTSEQGKLDRTKAAQQTGQDEIDPRTGLTYEELEGMDISEVWELIKNRRR
ncbi:MAG: prepilin-type N-terminal cleavage/methylation domain-containing protein [Planctomycetes bacterium]|nr:prepilin-type N-terminal cleavage/methylation domain-containing protein [Planctomycetota bacterium]